MATFTCLTCLKKFTSLKNDKNRTPKYCSRNCYAKRVITTEWIKKISLAKKGKIPWNKGVSMWKEKPHPKGTLGKKLIRTKEISSETRLKMRIAQLGKKKGKILKIQCKECKKEFVDPHPYIKLIRKYCSQKCVGLAKKIIKFCKKCNKELKYYQDFFCSSKCAGENKKNKVLSIAHRKALSGPRLHMRGEKAYNYTGSSNLRSIDMGRAEYRNWRKSVFERDQYTCQICLKKGGYLNADHIKPYSLFPEERYSLENGRTLCLECHKKTDTYLGKINLYKKLLRGV